MAKASFKTTDIITVCSHRGSALWSIFCFSVARGLLKCKFFFPLNFSVFRELCRINYLFLSFLFLRMRPFYTLLFLLCGFLFSLSGKAVEVREGYYRIQLNPTRGFAQARDNRQVAFIAKSTHVPNNAEEIWKLKPMGKAWAIISLSAGKMVVNQTRTKTIHELSDTPGFFYIKDNVTEGCVAIGNNETFAGNTSWHKGDPSRVIIWDYTVRDSQWKLLPVENSEIEAIFRAHPTYEQNMARAEERVAAHMANHAAEMAALPDPTKTYRLVNRSYTDRRLTSQLKTGETVARELNVNDYAQVFRFSRSFDGQLWAIQNVVSDKYIGTRAGRSKTYMATAEKQYFRFGKVQADNRTYYTFDGSELGLHEAQSQGHAVVAWESSSNASQWTFEEVTLDATKLEAQRASYAAFARDKEEAARLSAQHATITATLAKYFEDSACTELKAEHKSKDETTLRHEMTADQLPTQVQEMVVRVQKQVWNAENTKANKLERRFRIDEFIAHSDPYKWQNHQLAGTSFAFSRITSPTGITIPAGTAVQVYVNDDAPANCTLQVELVEGFSTGGKQLPLHRGFNNIFSDSECHLYIRYNIENTDVKLADCPPIRMHIEGGRVNGYYDRFKDSDETWQDMKELTEYGFLKDPVFRMKSKCYVISNSKDDVIKSERMGAWTFRGEKKSLSDVLEKMDAVNLLEQDITGVDQFHDRFNCVHFYSSNNSLYATTHGIWMGETLISYNMYTHLGENNEGGNLWALAHETGHHYQGIIDLQGAMESSNNMFSTVANWKLGGTVSRGGPMKDYFNFFYNEVPWADRTINGRVRMYYQLWQYYELLGNHKNFYQELANRFRQNPIRKGDANTDYLYFARTVCDLVQEDLTDFFTFHGFFNKSKLGRVRMLYGDNFYDGEGGYSPVYNEIKEADIDSTLRHIRQYQKKGGANLLFIDDRIRPTIDEVTGEWRTSCSGHATIGDSREVGDVGMYTDFHANATPQPTQVHLDGRKVYIHQQGAVGYKVYDGQGKLVFVSNSNHFVLPEKLDLSTLVVKVAGGNGEDQPIIERGSVLPQYNNYQSRNTTGLKTSTSEENPEYRYHICNGNQIANWLGQSSAVTTQTNSRAQFALFPGLADNTFYIYNVTTQQWLTYNPSNIGEGPRKTSWLSRAEKSSAQPWKIVVDERSKGFDIFPINSNDDTNESSWNWHGGPTANNTLGFYRNNDDNSVWQFVPVTAIDEVNFVEGSNGNFATLCLPYAITLPKGVTAYKGAPEGTHINLVRLAGEGEVVPLNTPVLLKSEKPGTMRLLCTANSTPSINTNWTGAHYLISNVELDKTHYTYYALTRRADNTFVMGIVDKANIPATRAYFRVLKNKPTATQRLFFSFAPLNEEDAVPTGISSSPENPAVAPALHDLSGRRSTGKQPGIYIQSGKRILVQ